METAIKDFIVCFTSILYEALPFIVLGALIAGIMEEMVPQQAITRLIPKSKYLAIGMGCLLGAVFPMCECGIVPIMRRLIRKGVPLATCVAYMLAGPIINIVVLLSTYAAFESNPGGYAIIALRAIFAFIVAYVTALVVDRFDKKFGHDLLTPTTRPSPLTLNVVDENGAAKAPAWKRIGNITSTALHDFGDITMFLILGALLAAFTRQWVTHNEIEAWSQNAPALVIGGMMLFAFVLCLCSEADAFIAASFTTMSPAGKLAFLVMGPMLDIKLLLMFTRVFRPKLIGIIVACVVTQVFVYMLILNHFWPNAAISPFGPTPGAAGP